MWNEAKRCLGQMQEHCCLLIGIDHSSSMMVTLGSIIRDKTAGILARTKVA